jgi:hypothetical protein
MEIRVIWSSGLCDRVVLSEYLKRKCGVRISHLFSSDEEVETLKYIIIG